MREIHVQIIPDQSPDKTVGDQLCSTVRIMSPNGVMYSQAFVPLHKLVEVTETLFSAALSTLHDSYRSNQ